MAMQVNSKKLKNNSTSLFHSFSLSLLSLSLLLLSLCSSLFRFSSSFTLFMQRVSFVCCPPLRSIRTWCDLDRSATVPTRVDGLNFSLDAFSVWFSSICYTFPHSNPRQTLYYFYLFFSIFLFTECILTIFIIFWD